jgi:hypothetical protein
MSPQPTKMSCMKPWMVHLVLVERIQTIFIGNDANNRSVVHVRRDQYADPHHSVSDFETRHCRLQQGKYGGIDRKLIQNLLSGTIRIFCARHTIQNKLQNRVLTFRATPTGDMRIFLFRQVNTVEHKCVQAFLGNM